MDSKQYLPLPAQPRGEQKRVVVIGGGVSGTMSAWELARAGHEVTLLEARNLGNGASSRSAACIRQQFETPSTIRGIRYAAQLFSGWQQYVGGAQSPIRQIGYLFLKDYLTNQDELRARIAMQQEVGLTEVELLDRAQIGERFPYLELSDITCATWCPVDGFLQPDLVFNGAAEAAVRLGAHIVCNAEVVGADVEGGKLRSVTTRDGRTFEADIFVNAAYVWAPFISRLCGGAELPICPEKRYLYFLPGPSAKSEYGFTADTVRDMPMIITPRGGYCRPDGNGPRIMTGWAHHTEVEDATFESQDIIRPGFAHSGDGEYGEAVRKELTSYLPPIHEMGQMVTATSGYYDATPDNNPIIDYDSRVENLIHAAGFSGHGLMHSPYTALIVTNLVSHGRGLPELELPFGIGSADLSSFALTREYKKEGMLL